MDAPPQDIYNSHKHKLADREFVHFPCRLFAHLPQSTVASAKLTQFNDKETWNYTTSISSPPSFTKEWYRHQNTPPAPPASARNPGSKRPDYTICGATPPTGLTAWPTPFVGSITSAVLQTRANPNTNVATSATSYCGWIATSNTLCGSPEARRVAVAIN